VNRRSGGTVAAASLSRTERAVLLGVQALVLGLPLLRGGRALPAFVIGCPLVLALLAITLEARRRSEGPHAVGVAPLAGFVALALATTVPLAPAWLAAISPQAARLAAAMLPGWPAAPEWSAWRALALDPYGVGVELARLSLGLGVFAVVVAFPWGDAGEEERRALVVDRLLLTLLAGGVLLAGLGLVQKVRPQPLLGGFLSAPRTGRSSGPFVNPNHFAAWLEMVIPLALAYLLALLARVRRRVRRAADVRRGTGLHARRAWAAAVLAHQGRLAGPLLAALSVLVMILAHEAAGSRGGTAAMLVGVGVAAAGAAVRGGRWAPTARWLAGSAALGLVLAGAVALGAWARSETDGVRGGALDAVDVSLGSRLHVAAKGLAVVRDYPLTGVGLGGWLHAFRPYQTPPIDGGIWDHAHDDYLELAAETGAAGVALVLLFCLAVVRAASRPRVETEPAAPGPEWREALRDRRLLRCGLAGGVAAILVHSLVDFGLRLPANLLLLMVTLALLVLTGAPRPKRPAPALGLLAVLLLVALALPAANLLLGASGAMPLAPSECLVQADRALAERGDAGRGLAIRLVHRALDCSPADREAHLALAEALGPGPDGDEAFRRALALEPWASEVRDRLALRLWARGERAAAAAEMEESLVRVPYLVSHSFLAADTNVAGMDSEQLRQAVVDGATLRTRLASLEPELAAAIDRGLTRALGDVAAGSARATTVEDLVSLHEARGQWATAAALLRDEAERSVEASGQLARAARDFLEARDATAAERALLWALVRAPGRGELYRRLALDVYAVRGDFASAESVLQAGERNAVDMLPVYQGVTELLARRESVRLWSALEPPAPRPGAPDGESDR
jgi:O-antigen ligase/polysaccharide polymerase Wzy-like membrane protein